MIRYRIGIINDFRDTFAFLDYKDYGELKIFDACSVGGKKKYQEAKDSIGVFLNFKMIGDFKVKEQAKALVRELVAKAPSDDFEKHIDVLLEAL